MYANQPPGVYFETDRGRRDPVPARTDIAGFVGVAARGPLFAPRRIESYEQFAGSFGQHMPDGLLAFAVEGFFINGGRTCWVVRVADPDGVQPASFNLLDYHGHATLRIEAIDPGTAGNAISIRVGRAGVERFSLTILVAGVVQERYRNLSMSADDEQYVVKVINADPERLRDRHDRRGPRANGNPTEPSRLVKVTVLTTCSYIPDSNPDPGAPNLSGGVGHLDGGADGLQTLAPQHFQSGLRGIEDVDEVAILAIPDLMWHRPEPPKPNHLQQRHRRPCGEFPPPLPMRTPLGNGDILRLQREMAAQCERQKDRFAILDVRRELADREAPFVKIQELRRDFSSKYAALYYPWIHVPGPAPDRSTLLPVPPSGHVAGIFARVDNTIGVHKPPANELLEGVRDLSRHVNDLLHADLNDNHVNVLRMCPGRGLRVLGARTLADPRSDGQWRFVNVRRLVMMIEETIDERTQSSVFEASNPNTWLDIDLIVRNLLEDLWRGGMLDGATPDEAFHVICDETTNSLEQREAGRIICEVGLLPPRPAEYVVIRLGMTERGTEILEGTEVLNA